MKRENKKKLPISGLKLYGHSSTQSGKRFNKSLVKMKYYDTWDNKFKKINREIIFKNIIDKVLNIDTELAKIRKQNNWRPTIGIGNYQANIMFIGDLASQYDVISGIPFCGEGGKILDECLKSIDLHRKEVYLTNIIKDYLKKDITLKEINLYLDIIKDEIDIINPKIIVGFGNLSKAWLKRLFKIEIAEDRFTLVDGKKLIFMQSPVSVVYKDKFKQILLNDFKKI